VRFTDGERALSSRARVCHPPAPHHGDAL